MKEGWLQVWCYSYRGAITSNMSANPVLLSDMPACTVQLYQTCMLGSFIQIHMFVKCFSIRQAIRYVANQVRRGYHWFVKLISYQPGRHLEYIKLLMHHSDVTRMMSVTKESVKSAFCIQISGVC